MRKTLFLLLSLAAIQVFAQDPEYKKIQLDTVLNDKKFPEKLKDEFPCITLKEAVTVEYITEGDEVCLYETIHRKTLVLNDKGVEYFNRVYIPTSRTIDIVDLKARAISPNGKITNFDKSNIKEVENLEDKGAYKMFAMEGVEKGSIVEVLYTLKQNVGSNGKYVFQEDFPILHASLSLYTFKNLVFNIKGYNCPFKVTDDTSTSKHIISYSIDSIPPLRDEKYSSYSANKAKVEYQFSYNKETSTTSLNTWASAAKGLYDAFYKEDKNEDKLIQKQLNKLKLDKLSELEKVKAIEIYIKDNITLKPVRGIPDIESITFSLKNKFTNEDGLTRLFCKFFQLAGINHQLGCTSDRSKCKFDKDFMTWQYLYEYVIYFPNLNTYLSPTESQFRLGMLPDEVTNNDVLFLKTLTIGSGFTSALPDIKSIPNTPYEKSYTNQIASIELDAANLVTKVHYRHELAGYEANYIQPYYDFLPEDKKTEVMESILKFMNEDTKIVDFKLENTNHNESPFDKPFIIDSHLEVKNLIEKAGESIIFKLGEVIGRQEEMYDDHKRENPIELEYAHYYMRDIRVKIPDGYTIKGTDAIPINKACASGAAGFLSTYKIENNELIVSVKEFYRDVMLPIEQYEDFRKVINAAADFNKISIVFEKK